jgi:ketosteroid isomerase-like protein
MSIEAEVERVRRQMDVANTRMLEGDSRSWKELLSRREDVTLLGAYGGRMTGWAEVSARFDRTAATYGAGGRTGREPIATWVSPDLACIVDLERHETHFGETAESVTFVYRTTHVLRREDGSWKVVLRHADPLETFRGPAFAHGLERE